MSNNDDLSALEKCFRPFIIKCIQAIVQARSGNVYNTSCMSDVGARNNMMVYIEDDPEIGATIKQSLDSGFSVKLGDSFTVEIYGKVGNELPLLEVWHFSIDSSESNTNGTTGASNQPSNSSTSPNSSTGVTDIRRTRFLERLGTLLKTLLVTTRMLPAYANSRKPILTNEPLCFLVRRGPPPALSALGPHCQGRSVGNISVPTLAGVMLKLYVHYRSFEAIRLLREKQTELLNAPSQEFISQKNTKIEDETSTKSKNQSKASTQPSIKNRPAFASNYVDYDDEHEENYDGATRKNITAVRKTIDDDDEEEEDSDDADDYNEERYRSRSGGNQRIQAPTPAAAIGTSPDDPFNRLRLQLPFSNNVNSEADISRHFSDLKLRHSDLGLFAPQGGGNAQLSEGLGMDLSSLKEELFLHERTSVEFDNFMHQFEESRHTHQYMHHSPTNQSGASSGVLAE